jgi:PDZ domain
MTDKNLQEILSGDDEKVRQMLGDLKRVDAPKDFDFRLKARIAAADPRAFQPRMFPFLRVAAPLALGVIVLAFFVINGLFSVNDGSVAPVALNPAPGAVEKENLPNDLPLANQGSSVANYLNPEKAEISPLESKPGFHEKQSVPASGGSKDSAATAPNKINPLGIDPNKIIEKPNDFKNIKPLVVKEILSALGIEANLSRGEWKVQSVTQNGKAERSGVKPNDVITAIDNRKISTETLQTNSFEGKKITVVRDGKKLEIVLQ